MLGLDLIFGGLTGLIGTIWSGYNQRKIQELEMKGKEESHKYSLEMIKAESEAMLAEANANIKITESQVMGTVELAEVQAFGQSQLHGNTKSLPSAFAEKLANVNGWAKIITIPLLSILCFLLGLADFIKGLARPAITAYLLAISTWLSYKAWQLLEATNSANALSPSQAIDIVEQSISVLLYLSTTAVTWWFGDRMTEKSTKNLFKRQN